MSTNSYLPEPNELSAVSLHFFESRLQIKLIMLTMNMLSLILASLVMLVFQTNGNISYNSIFFVGPTTICILFKLDSITKLLLASSADDS